MFSVSRQYWAKGKIVSKYGAVGEMKIGKEN
jgi:hypothetical protein